MKHDRNVVAVQWPGLDALKAARDGIKRGCEVAVELPVGTHYALYRQLHPGKSGRDAGRVDAAGGAEMLAPIAAVSGLEELARLRAAVQCVGYGLRLTSPEPTLLLIPPE